MRDFHRLAFEYTSPEKFLALALTMLSAAMLTHPLQRAGKFETAIVGVGWTSP
jgi:hypothetical protein